MDFDYGMVIGPEYVYPSYFDIGDVDDDDVVVAYFHVYYVDVALYANH